MAAPKLQGSPASGTAGTFPPCCGCPSTQGACRRIDADSCRTDEGNFAMPLNRSIFFLAVMTGGLLCMAAPAAEAQQQPQTAPGEAPQSQAVSDKEIETFAAAATEVRRLNKQWAPRLEAAANESTEAEEAVRRQ